MKGYKKTNSRDKIHEMNSKIQFIRPQKNKKNWEELNTDLVEKNYCRINKDG